MSMKGMLETELAAAVAGGVTSLVVIRPTPTSGA
jgi:dihydroorotase-like cyclic amidohydrolase